MAREWTCPGCGTVETATQWIARHIEDHCPIEYAPDNEEDRPMVTTTSTLAGTAHAWRFDNGADATHTAYLDEMFGLAVADALLHGYTPDGIAEMVGVAEDDLRGLPYVAEELGED